MDAETIDGAGVEALLVDGALLVEGASVVDGALLVDGASVDGGEAGVDPLLVGGAEAVEGEPWWEEVTLVGALAAAPDPMAMGPAGASAFGS